MIPTLPQFSCRSCHSRIGAEVLNLGLQPLANRLLRPDDLAQPEPRFPLRLAVCHHCWLLQITDIVPPTDLFSEYLYFSSFSDALLQHARLAASRYIQEFQLSEKSLVVEIASNDGYLLKNFVQSRIPCLGIEPASNIAAAARSNGVPTLTEFFSNALAQSLAASHPPADLILGNNVFAHVPDPNDFVAGLATLLAPNGRIILEFPYACDLIEHSEFDTIYHEHVFYFHLHALLPLFQRHGLEIYHVERLPIHGGSLRLFAGHQRVHPPTKHFSQLLAAESAQGIPQPHYYAHFRASVESLRTQLLELLRQLSQTGHSIAAYGASAKGSTLLNYYGIGNDLLQFVVDRSPHKQGLFTPGTHLPILPVEALLQRQPHYALLLTWNFASEILQQQSEYRKRGGKFIRPIPTVEILDGF